MNTVSQVGVFGSENVLKWASNGNKLGMGGRVLCFT
jgi:hypothetical protein